MMAFGRLSVWRSSHNPDSAYFILILIAQLLLFSSCGKEKNSHVELNLRGHVQKYLEQSYEAREEFDQIIAGDKSNYGNYLAVFDENKNIAERRYFLKRGQVDRRYIFKYDGLNLSSVDVYNGAGESRGKVINEFEGDKMMIHKEYDEDGSLLSEYHYDYSGAKVTGQRLIRDGVEVKRWEIKYSGDIVIEELIYDTSSVLQFRREYEYNSKGDVEVEREYGEDGELEGDYSMTYEYDDKGNWIKKYTTVDDKVEYIRTRQYLYFGEDEVLDQNKLQGKWYEVSGNMSFELQSNGNYNIWYSDKLDEYGDWSFTSAENNLVFRLHDRKRTREFNCELTDFILHMDPERGSDKMFMKQ